MSGPGRKTYACALEAGKILLSGLLHQQRAVLNYSDSSFMVSCKRSETVKEPAASQAGASKAAPFLVRCFPARYRLHHGLQWT